MPKISVVIPVYGVEKYIERCAISLFEQTLDDIEYIFVDDCTPDRSMMILNTVINKYRFRLAKEKKVVRTERMLTNSGQAAVRKHGIQLCTGDYIIHCDSDDWVDTNMYNIMYNEAITNNADIVSCNYYLSDGINHTPYKIDKENKLLQGPVWNRLVKRELYRDSRVKYPKANKAEDSALMMQLSFLADKKIFIPKYLYYYFINPESICHVPTMEACLKRFEDELLNTDLVINFLIENCADKNFSTDIILRKSFARDALLPLLNNCDIYQKWLNTYKEINYQYLLSKDISFKKKLGFLKRMVFRR